MPAKPNRSPLESLFDDFVEALRERVKDPDCEAASLGVIRAFLKDQNISADEDKHEGLHGLVHDVRKKKMPFAEGPSEDDLTR